MDWRKALCVLGAGLCCAGVLMAGEIRFAPPAGTAEAAAQLAIPLPPDDGQGDSRACVGTMSYDNMDNTGWYDTETGLAIADDLYLHFNIHPLTCVRVYLYANAGTAYTATVAFHTACPPTAGNMIANSSHTFTGIAVGWQTKEWSYPSGSHPNPAGASPIWLVVTFSRTGAGWGIGGQAELGTTTNIYAGKDSPTQWTCNYNFGEQLWAGLNCQVWEEDVLGACCLDATSQCIENQPEFDCEGVGGRWVANTLCANIVPPCGQGRGACCHPDGTCTLTLPTQCSDLYLGITTTCDQCPCIVPCPSGAHQEAEPCGQSANNGCGGTPEAFSDVQCGWTICGTVLADTATGYDVDWWKLILAQEQLVTFSLQSEFPVLMGFAFIEPDGNGNCADYAGYIGPYRETTAPNCPPGVNVKKICPPGTYYFIVESSVTDGYPCTSAYNHYVGTVTCEAPPPPPCDQALYINFTGNITDWDWALQCTDNGGAGAEVQIADDFTLTAGADVGRVDWGGDLWAGELIQPDSFNIIFYNDDGTGNAPVLCLSGDPTIPPSTDNALAIYHVALADMTWFDIGAQAYYQAELLPPLSLAGSTKYWIVLESHAFPPPAWGPLCHLSPIMGHNAVEGNTHYDPPTNFWSDPDLGGALVDVNFCLAPGGAAPCPTTLGDVNGDGLANNFDITPFVYAVTHTQAEFESVHPTWYYWCADANSDNLVNNFDITPFVRIITTPP